jgi:hypothetical protein
MWRMLFASNSGGSLPVLNAIGSFEGVRGIIGFPSIGTGLKVHFSIPLGGHVEDCAND